LQTRYFEIQEFGTLDFSEFWLIFLTSTKNHDAAHFVDNCSAH